MIGRLALSAPVLFAACAAGPAAAHGDPAFHPQPSDVEGRLHWHAGSVCRSLIDACLDSEGNEINPLPEFKVSNLECRFAANRSSVCSFTSVKTFGLGDVRPAEHCAATFVRNRSTHHPQLSWDFAYHPRGRRSFARSPVLTCN